MAGGSKCRENQNGVGNGEYVNSLWGNRGQVNKENTEFNIIRSKKYTEDVLGAEKMVIQPILGARWEGSLESEQGF